MEIKISVATMFQQFHPCSPEYITSTCKGRCCQGTGKIMVTVHETERERFKEMGAELDGNFIKADDRGLCPFKTHDGFCAIHDKKPFGCAASPFTLSKNNVLIIRNRYRMLRCYKCNMSAAAYRSHFFSLIAIFGEDEANRLYYILDNIKEFKQGDFIIANISEERFKMLKDNDAAKK